MNTKARGKCSYHRAFMWSNINNTIFKPSPKFVVDVCVKKELLNHSPLLWCILGFRKVTVSTFRYCMLLAGKMIHVTAIIPNATEAALTCNLQGRHINSVDTE